MAKLLARTVRGGEYRFTPARVARAQLDKERDLYSFVVPDLLVHGVVARTLERMAAPGYSSSLYSYRSGRSNIDALQAFGSFLRAHFRRVNAPQERGLYVLRADIRRYGETIPVDESARLWDVLARLLGLESPEEFRRAGTAAWLIAEVVRPDVRREGSPTATKDDCGLPTGSPVVPVISNLYLSRLDHDLASIPGGFYARFGDDILFAAPEQSKAGDVEGFFREELKKLGLELNEEKLRRLYFTGAGRKPPPEKMQWMPATSVDYLGYTVAFRGEIRVTAEKLRETLGDLRNRLRNAAREFANLDPDGRGRLLSRLANQVFTPEFPAAAPHAQGLLRLVSDRSQLKWLDHAIALEIARLVSGRTGPKAFRAVPYEKIRREWGLKSLVVARNAYE